MGPNPYQIRNAIRDERFFIGRSKELEEIVALVNAPQPQSIAVIGDRRIGKSSLLQALYRKCRQGDTDKIVVYQDVNGMHSAEEVLSVLCDNLSVAGHVSVASGQPPHATLRRLISALTRQSSLVLLLDEFDALTRQDAFPVTFFNFLRSLANEFPVAFVLTAARKLKDICHSEEIAGSPFFNIFHERRLGCFSEQEALQLIEAPSRLCGRPLDALAPQILSLVGRWPLFLQIACYWLIEVGETGLSAAARDAARGRTSEDVLPHLNYLWRQLLPLERHALIEASRHGSPVGVPTATIDALVTRGLLAREGGRTKLAFQLLDDFVAGVAQHVASTTLAREIPIFVSYCHRDAGFVERWGLLEALQDLRADGFKIFSDHEVATGDVWDDVLVRRLKESRVLVALVTPDYLRSRYCQEVEIKAFWDGRVKDGMLIFPVILGRCEWERHSWLATTQFFPRKGSVMALKPLKRREILIDILKELRATRERLKP